MINEVEEQDIGIYNPEEDKLSALNIEHNRKPKITLRHINRLKKIRATNKVEQLQKEELLSAMYGSKPEEGDEGGF